MRVALLSSRKPRQIDPEALWLRRTSALAGEVARAGDVLVTSIGNLPYEVALYGAARAGGRIEVVLPTGATEAQARALLPEGYPGERLEIRRASGKALTERDRAVIDAADQAVAVAVRAGGHMEGLLRERWLERRGLAVVEGGEGTETAGNRRFLAEGVPRLEAALQGGVAGANAPGAAVADTPACLDAPASLSGVASHSPSVLCGGPFGHWERAPLVGPTLAHFTRACEGPWPGQTRRDYLEDLWQGGERARRNGPATLRRILATGRILGSGRLIRGGFPVVSLSAVTPAGLLELHRYRRHLLRWDFEPLGLVFSREWLEACGARPVAYLPPEAFASLSAVDRPWYQKHQPPACDYSAEQEWRVLGDIDLGLAPREGVRVFGNLREGLEGAGAESGGGVGAASQSSDTTSE